MEVMPGYKQTEVGVIPEDWEVTAIGDKTEKVGSGITPTGGQRVYRSEGRPFMRSQNVGWGNLLLDDVAFIDDATHSNFPETEIQLDDVFLNITGASIGRSAVADSRIVGGNVNQHVCIVRATQSKLVPRYLNLFLLSAAGQRQIDSFQAGGNRQGLNFAQVRSMRIPLPATETEQRAIAAAVIDVDVLLGGLERLIAKKRDLKQAAMQQLLTGQTRLPGFSGEWEVRPLASAIASLEAGVSVNSVEHGKPLRSGEPCILKTSAIFDGFFDPEECKLIDQRDTSRAKLSPKRDTIIISRMNTPNLVGEVGYVPDDFPTLNLPDRLWMTRLDPKSDICARWLAYVLSSAQVKENIKGLATGTSGSMKNIGKGKLLALQLEFPTGDEQTAIAAVLSDMDAEISALVARRDKTRDLKQAMMQELLTGRTRLV
jgi:type I restriction enzyme S subunit